MAQVYILLNYNLKLEDMKNQNPVKKKEKTQKITPKNAKNSSAKEGKVKKKEKEFDTLHPVGDDLDTVDETTDETSRKIRNRDENRNEDTDDDGIDDIRNETEFEEDEETPEITDDDDTDEPRA